MMRIPHLIVMAPPGVIEFVAKSLREKVSEVDILDHHLRVTEKIGEPPTMIPIKPLGKITREELAGRVVFGALPYKLAVWATCVMQLETTGKLEPGAEITLAALEKAGAHVASYCVFPG